MHTDTLTQAEIKDIFDYQDGYLYWKIATSRRVSVGDRVGDVKSNGYRYVGLKGRRYLAHQLIYLWHHGYIPQQIDHIDGSRGNSRIENLRPANDSQNQMNRRKSPGLSSKYKGVSWAKRDKCWVAYIDIEGKRRSLGSHKEEADAARAYNVAAHRAFGEFAKLNVVE